MPQAAADAGEVEKRWDRCDQQLIEDRRNYWLNLSFYAGFHWVYWDQARQRLDLLPDRQSESDRERITLNAVGSRIDSLLGRQQQHDLSFEAQATSTDDVSRRGANLAEFICEADRSDQDWESVRGESLLATWMAGTAAVAIDWDTNGGEEMGEDEELRPVKLGRATLTALPITEFSLEPGTKKWSDARWWIRRTALPPVQVQKLYHLSKPPPADATPAATPLQSRLLTDRGSSRRGELTYVTTLYELPDDEGPETNKGGGWVTTVVAGAIVQQVAWDFPFERLNLVVFRQRSKPSMWTGDTVMNSARGIQVAINKIHSNFMEHLKRTANATLLVPDGTDDDEEYTDQPGEVRHFNPDLGKPEYMNPPDIARWLMTEAETLVAQLDDTLFTHAISMGQWVGNRNSGLAMSLVAEKDNSPLGPMSREQAAGWGHLASMALQMYEARTPQGTQRETTVTLPSGGAEQRKWTGKDLAGQTKVRVPIDNVMPSSKVATQAMMTSLAQAFPQIAQGMDLATLGRLIEMPNLREMISSLDPDVAKAESENEMMAQGNTQVPMQWHDHAKHIDTHNKFRNSARWDTLDLQTQDMVNEHCKVHALWVQEAQQAQPDAAQTAQSAPSAPGPQQQPAQQPAQSQAPT